MCVSLRNLARLAAVVLLPLAIAGCMSSPGSRTMAAIDPGPDPYYLAMYGPQPNERFPLPAMDIRKVDPQFFRQQVRYDGPERPGTIVVDTANRFLYLVQERGMAMRYGIGVGKEGLAFEGTAKIGRKAQWPRWTPTANMIAREPERNAKWANGMEPGLTNPLGPRALYLYQDGNDTLYRLHGTTEPWSIGKAVSSGCIRLFNQDIIDLYGRVPVGATVVVKQNEGPAMDDDFAPPMADSQYVTRRAAG